MLFYITLIVSENIHVFFSLSNSFYSMIGCVIVERVTTRFDIREKYLRS